MKNLGTCFDTARLHLSPSNLTWHSIAMQRTTFVHVPPPHLVWTASKQFKRHTIVIIIIFISLQLSQANLNGNKVLLQYENVTTTMGSSHSRSHLPWPQNPNHSFMRLKVMVLFHVLRSHLEARLDCPLPLSGHPFLRRRLPPPFRDGPRRCGTAQAEAPEAESLARGPCLRRLRLHQPWCRGFRGESRW